MALAHETPPNPTMLLKFDFHWKHANIILLCDVRVCVRALGLAQISKYALDATGTPFKSCMHPNYELWRLLRLISGTPRGAATRAQKLARRWAIQVKFRRNRAYLLDQLSPLLCTFSKFLFLLRIELGESFNFVVLRTP